MRTLFAITLCIATLTSASVFASTAVWTAKKGIQTPESAFYSDEAKAIFVSNVAGDAGTKDGKGWISKLSPQGKVLKEKWATGLNAPKGLRAHKGTLWVSDIDQVAAFDLKTGKQKAKITIDGAKFLNDVAADEKTGDVYISDMLTSKIHVVRAGKNEAETFAEGPELESPNGLLVQGDRLLVASWGLTTDLGSAPATPGHLYSLDLKTKEKKLISPEPLGNLDGLELAGSGSSDLIISDWMKGTVFRVQPDGSAKEIMSLGQGTADIGVLPASGKNKTALLLVPSMMKNEVNAIKIP